MPPDAPSARDDPASACAFRGGRGPSPARRSGRDRRGHDQEGGGAMTFPPFPRSDEEKHQTKKLSTAPLRAAKKAGMKREGSPCTPYKRKARGKETRPGSYKNILRPRACVRARYAEAGAAAEDSRGNHTSLPGRARLSRTGFATHRQERLCTTSVTRKNFSRLVFSASRRTSEVLFVRLCCTWRYRGA